MADETAPQRDGPLPVGVPYDATASMGAPGEAVRDVVRAMCRRLYTVEDNFVSSFRVSLAQLVPELQRAIPDGGEAIAESLARAVLWAGLTSDPPNVVEETFRNVGIEYSRRGFPLSGYHGAGHALLRAARDTQVSEWTSELSSAWVAYYSWLAAHLALGAENAWRNAPPPSAAHASATGLPVPPGSFSPPPTGPPIADAFPFLPFRPSETPTLGTPSPGAPRATTDPSPNSMAGPSPNSMAGPSPNSMAGPSPNSMAGPSPNSMAGPSPNSMAGPSPNSMAGPSPNSMAGPSPNSMAGPSPNSMAGPSPNSMAGPMTTSPGRPVAGATTGPPAGAGPATSPGQTGTGAESNPSSLDELLDLLRARYFAGSERALGAIVTRVALRTGADLRAPRPDQRTNPAVIANVIAVLQAMGYVLPPSGPDVAALAIFPPPPPARRARWWSRRRAGSLRGWRSSLPGPSR